MNYQNLFQFAFNDKQVNIKILSVAFYTINNLEVLYRLLFDIVLTLFDVSFREEFKVSRLDFAIDIKYNFDFIGELLKKDKPDFGFKFLGKLSKVEEDKGRSVTLKSGDVQLCVYDKVFEVFQSNDEKKEIYSKLYDIDFFNKYNLLEYQKADYHIVRFEYRLLNKQKLMAKRDITIEKVFFNENYIKYLIEELIKNHTSLNHEEDNLYKLILATDEPVEIKRVKFDEENYLFAELENCINITLSYLTSIQSKMVVLHGIENNYPGYEKMFEYMKSKLTDFDYFNKVTAVYHDESHLNKFLLDRKIKVLSTNYGRPEEWETPQYPKMIFRDKYKIFGDEINKMKGIKSRCLFIRFIEKMKRVIQLLILSTFLCDFLNSI